MTTKRDTAGESHLAHWLGYSAFAGWLTGPLLGAALWLGRGAGQGGQLSLGPESGFLPLAGFVLLWALYASLTRSALAVSWGRATHWATSVLAAGSTGWLLVQFLHLPTGGSINTLALAWAALTLPYPAAAACAFHRAIRPDETAVTGLQHHGVRRLLRHRPQAVAVGCVAAMVLGLALESVNSTPAHAAAIPVRSAYAEPEAPDAMMLLVRPPRGYTATSYGYVNGVATISYLSSDAATAVDDDLEVIVAPRAAAPSACGVDWAAADGEIDAAAGTEQLPCKQLGGEGRLLADDGIGDTLYIGEYKSYYVALAVSAEAARPIAPSVLPALFATLHLADTGQRALLNAQEDSLATT